MAHNLEIINGKASMFSVKEVPWHGLGHIVEEAPTAEEAMKLAGLDWNVLEQTLFRANKDGTVKAIDDWKVLSRDSDNNMLGIVHKDYHPLQNSEAFSFFNPFVESGLASFETAGSLRGGKVVWVLARLNKAPIEVGKGDEVNKYLLISNGHDGSMAVRVGFTPIRVVCNNTLSMSHSAKDSRLLRLFHSRAVNANLVKVQEIINAADAKFEATTEQYRALARSDVDQESLKKYVEVVFGFEADKKGLLTMEDQRKAMAKERVVQDITRLFETGRGQALPGAKGTCWGLYNAVTEYLTWEKGRTEDSRMNSVWFGANRNLNSKAFTAAMQMVAA